MSQAHTRQQAAQDAGGDQGDLRAERSCSGDLRALHEQMVPSIEDQLYRPRPGDKRSTQPAGFNSDQREMLGGTSIGGEQILNRELLGPFLPRQCNQGDKIELRSGPGDLRGQAQQEMAPRGENQHEVPAHGPQAAGLDLSVQPVLAWNTTAVAPVPLGHEGAPQQQGVPRDGSEDLYYEVEPSSAEQTIHPPIFGVQQGGVQQAHTNIPAKVRLPGVMPGRQDIYGNVQQAPALLRLRELKRSRRPPDPYESRHNRGRMAQASSQPGLQDRGGLSNSQNVRVQDSSQGFQEDRGSLNYAGWQRHGLQSTVRVPDSSQGLQTPGSNVQRMPLPDLNPALQSTRSSNFQRMPLPDFNQGLQSTGSSNSQRMPLPNLKQALPNAGFANNSTVEEGWVHRSKL